MTDSNTRPIRAAVIGLGKMGMVHAATIRTNPNVDVVAFCETSKFMSGSLKPFFPDVRFYDDHNKMLDEANVDAVWVTTPTASSL